MLVAGIGLAAIEQQMAVNQSLREDLVRQVDETRNRFAASLPKPHREK
jgi:hypothetical protein